MKTYIFLTLSVFTTILATAQSITLQPDVFELPKLSSTPVCTITEKGRMYYDESTNKVLYCNGSNWNSPGSQWKNVFGTDNIYFQDKVGIGNANPAYNLDINGSANIKYNLNVGGSFCFGGTLAESGFNILNETMNFVDTRNNKRWSLLADSTSGSFRVRDDGFVRMAITDNGNIGIGVLSPTAKLDVYGDANIFGNIKVNNGKGIVQNATDDAQLKMHIGQLNINSLSTINANSTSTYTMSLPLSLFSSAPAASIGQLLSTPSPFGEIGKLVISVASVTTTTVTVRMFNPTANVIQIKGAWKIICVGE